MQCRRDGCPGLIDPCRGDHIFCSELCRVLMAAQVRLLKKIKRVRDREPQNAEKLATLNRQWEVLFDVATSVDAWREAKAHPVK